MVHLEFQGMNTYICHGGILVNVSPTLHAGDIGKEEKITKGIMYEEE